MGGVLRVGPRSHDRWTISWQRPASSPVTPVSLAVNTFLVSIQGGKRSTTPRNVVAEFTVGVLPSDTTSVHAFDAYLSESEIESLVAFWLRLEVQGRLLSLVGTRKAIQTDAALCRASWLFSQSHSRRFEYHLQMARTLQA